MTVRLLLASLLLIVTHAYATDIAVTEATCNGMQNPLAVADSMPYFSWKLSSTVRGQHQTAYQVLVATSPEKLNDATADVWNTGKVASSQSLYVRYKGKPLQSRARYYWTVRAWDAKGIASAYTPPQHWQMAVMDVSEWTAKWISAPVVFDLEKLNRHRYAMIEHTTADDYTEPLPLLRKEFSVRRPVQRAVLYVAAPGFYDFFINGKKAGDQHLDPAFTNFDKTVLYTVLDVTTLLQPGTNAAGVMLGNGWYNSVTKEVWGFDKAPWRNLPTLRCQLDIVYDDASTERIITDESWQAHTGPITFSSLRQGEYYDARLEIPQWHHAGLDTKAWVPVRIVGGPIGTLRPQNLPPVTIHNTLKPVKNYTLPNGHVVYDFGQNMAGFAGIDVQGTAGKQVQLVYGERTHTDGSVDQSNIDNLNTDLPFQTDRYTLKGGAAETWRSQFVYHGFRFVEVWGLEGGVKVNAIEAYAVSSSFVSSGSFTCSDPLINAIQKATEWSYRNNFVGFPTDCPQREKNGWTGDAQLACATGLTNFDAANAYKKWLRDIEDEQQPNGSLPGIIPTNGWGYYWGNGPAWDIACVVVPYTVYEFTADTLVLRQHYGMMKKYVDYMHTRSENYIAAFGLGDWIPVKTTTPADLTSTGYFYYGASTLATCAKILGKTDDANTYTALAAQIKEAFTKKYFNAATNTYANGSQTALSCALFHHLADAQTQDAVLKNLVAEVHAKDNHIDCGILGSRYIFNVLSEHGQVDLAYTMIHQPTYPGWGYMIGQGATTLWEDWKGEASLNHIMLGDVSAWFYKNLAGIQPDNAYAGFKHFIVKPNLLGNITFATARQQSPYGVMTSEWKRDGKRFTHTVTVPVNTSATVYIPAKAASAVKESRKVLSKAAGISSTSFAGGLLKAELASGQYVFTSELP